MFLLEPNNSRTSKWLCQHNPIVHWPDDHKRKQGEESINKTVLQRNVCGNDAITAFDDCPPHDKQGLSLNWMG